MRRDETGNLIQGLERVEANEWGDRNKAASDAIMSVDDAREEAWEALDEASQHMDRTSMR